jgi:hypothetical protein
MTPEPMSYHDVKMLAGWYYESEAEKEREN